MHAEETVCAAQHGHRCQQVPAARQWPTANNGLFSHRTWPPGSCTTEPSSSQNTLALSSPLHKALASSSWSVFLRPCNQPLFLSLTSRLGPISLCSRPVLLSVFGDVIQHLWLTPPSLSWSNPFFSALSLLTLLIPLSRSDVSLFGTFLSSS